MGRPTKIIIHFDALRHNFQQIKRLAPQSSILAMVKSNAYGHGIQRVAKALPDADGFGVACIEEGMALREAGIHQPIVLMEGLFHEDELSRASQHDFSLVVHHESQVLMLEKNPNTGPFSVWLKINTGMHRLGFETTAVPAIYERLTRAISVKQPIRLMTHFASADSSEDSTTLQQLALFNQTMQMVQDAPRSLCNSAGIMAYPIAHGDWVRPGIMLYGVSPFAGKTGSELGLRPVMSLVSQLIATHEVKKGERIGYAGTWVCPDDRLIGVIAVGYGDGYPQCARNGTPLLVNGKSCPLVGRVSMDMLTVDLRSQPEAKVGDSVVLWGSDLPIETVAENNHTSAYELLTRITQRVLVECL